MKRPVPVYRIHDTARIHVLAATSQGLAWRSFPIARKTPRSVAGNVQLARDELERRGRVDAGGEVFSLSRFELPK